MSVCVWLSFTKSYDPPKAEYVLRRIPILGNANKVRDREINGRDMDTVE
jgi:hypothetical protein